MVGAPPVDVSPKLPAAEQAQRRAAIDKMSKVYDALQAIYEAPTTLCDLRGEVCKKEWSEVAKKLLETEDLIPRAGNFGLCGSPPDDLLDETIQLERQHEAFLRKLVLVVRAELDARVAETGVFSEQVWLKLVTRPMPGAIAMPCLSCVAPSSYRYWSPLNFHDDDATIEPSLVADLVRLLQDNPKAPVILRGHADPGEKNPEKLALDRANAVKAALVKAGVDKSRITAIGLGADYTIASSTTEEGRGLNRAVWVGAIKVR